MNIAAYSLQTVNFLSQINQLFPRLSGHLNDTSVYTFRVGVGEDIYHIKRLYNHLQQRYPEGGKAFWSCRTWALLIWQPIYIAVLSVQLLNKAISLEKFGLIVEQADIVAYSLSPRAIYSGKQAHLINFSGQQIKKLSSYIYSSLSEIIPFNIKLANKLQTDCIVSALLFQNTQYAHCNKFEMDKLIAIWLSATGLPDCQGTFCLDAPGKFIGQNFGFNRQACCQEFRLESGKLCDVCPRLPLSERIERITQTERIHYAKS